MTDLVISDPPLCRLKSGQLLSVRASRGGRKEGRKEPTYTYLSNHFLHTSPQYTLSTQYSPFSNLFLDGQPLFGCLQAFCSAVVFIELET
jgi:hypothetical protein